jgi:2-dehydropantoate 2-reductase
MINSTPDQIRSLIIGAGAIGTYIGGSLAAKAHPVVFLEVPDVASELQKRGLSLRINDNTSYIGSPSVVTTIEQALKLGPFDVVIFALKAYDTKTALSLLAPYSHKLPPFLCLQNGVDNESTLENVLGSHKVIPATLTSAVGRLSVGEIVLERKRGIGISASNPLSHVLMDVFNNAGLNASLYPDADAMKWSKLLTNLISNASSAILDMTPGEIFANPDLYRLEIAQLREVLDVMRAKGIEVVNLPGTQVRLLSFAIRKLPTQVSQPFVSRAVSSGRGSKMPSFYIDLHKGHGKSEVDYLNGAIVRHGQTLGIPTPVNRLLNETLLKLTKGELPINAFRHNPKKLLDLLN